MRKARITLLVILIAAAIGTAGSVNAYKKYFGGTTLYVCYKLGVFPYTGRLLGVVTTAATHPDGQWWYYTSSYSTCAFYSRFLVTVQ